MTRCLTCGGAVFKPNQIVGYAGEICSCIVPPRYQRLADTPTPAEIDPEVFARNWSETVNNPRCPVCTHAKEVCTCEPAESSEQARDRLASELAGYHGDSLDSETKNIIFKECRKMWDAAMKWRGK